MDLFRNLRILIGSVFMNACLLSSGITYADQGTIKECQRIKDKVDHYTSLRRTGGSAKKMEAWRKDKKSYEAKFSKMHCLKLHGKLK